MTKILISPSEQDNLRETIKTKELIALQNIKLMEKNMRLASLPMLLSST